MLTDLCSIRRLGFAAAASVSVVGSVVLIYRLVTPQSVHMMLTAELVALVAMLLLPALTLLTMRRAGTMRRMKEPGGIAGESRVGELEAVKDGAMRAERHRPEADGGDRGERHRRRAASGAKR